MEDTKEKVITEDVIEDSMSYEEYRELINNLLDEDKTTGGKDSEDLVNYTRMNVQRMRRLDKTIELDRKLRKKLDEVERSWYWVVLTEGWCGDAAQNVPAVAKMAEANPKIELCLLLRDEHLEIMDEYLTDGGRSIPKLICIDAQTMEELGTWGPRPEPAQQMVREYKQTEDRPYKELARDLHKWYAEDKTETLQEEMLDKLDQWMN